MSSLRLPAISCQTTKDLYLNRKQNATKPQPRCPQSNNGFSNKFDSGKPLDYEEQSLLNGLDKLDDDELDELLKETREINKRLRKHLADDDELDMDVEVQDQFVTGTTRNNIVLPPIVKKGSEWSRHMVTK